MGESEVSIVQLENITVVDEVVCTICLSGESEGKLERYCLCKNPNHRRCINAWVKNNNNRCKVCNFKYNVDIPLIIPLRATINKLTPFIYQIYHKVVEKLTSLYILRDLTNTRFGVNDNLPSILYELVDGQSILGLMIAYVADHIYSRTIISLYSRFIPDIKFTETAEVTNYGNLETSHGNFSFTISQSINRTILSRVGLLTIYSFNRFHRLSPRYNLYFLFGFRLFSDITTFLYYKLYDRITKSNMNIKPYDPSLVYIESSGVDGLRIT